VAIVELVVLENHDICHTEGILQPMIVDVAMPYAAQCEEALLELGIEVRGDDARRGEAAGNGGKVKLVTEYAAVKARVVGRLEEIIKLTTCEHEGKKGARGRGRRVVVAEREDDAVFHCELYEEKGEGHVEEEEARRDKRKEREGARI
jgi:hypothetical protein